MFQPGETNTGETRDRWPTYQPMVLVVVALALGISLDRWLNLNWQICLAASGLCLVLWTCIWKCGQRNQTANVVSQRWEISASTLLLIGLVFAAAFWHHGRWNWFGQYEIGRFATSVAAPCCVDADVISEPRWQVVQDEPHAGGIEDSVRTRLSVRVRQIRDGAKWKPASGIADLVIHAETNHIRSGDRIRIFGKLVATSPPSNPGQFDFQEFYRAKSRLAALHAYEINSVVVTDPAGWTSAQFLSSLRQRLNEITWKYVDETEAAFASAILLGNREQLSKPRRDSFLETGTVHLLAISGLHVGILAGTFLLFFRFGLLSRKKSLLLTIAFVVFYVWLVEFRAPVTRAAILIVLFCLGRLWGERSFSFNLLAMAGIVVLLINPSDLFGIGPQLSFLAVATLTFGADWVFWQPSKDPIKRLIASTRPTHVRLFNWSGRQFRTAILVSGLIWLIAMPLVAYRFHLIAPVALVINPLLLIPIAWGLYGGLGVLIFGWFLPPAARMCGWFCDRNLALIEWMIGVGQAVPYGHFWTAGPPAWSIGIFYSGLLLFAVFPMTRLLGRWIATLGAVWLVFGWLAPDQIAKYVDRGSERALVCTFIDVGHGSSVLLQLPDGRNLLYDAGSFAAAEYGARNIAGVLWSERIEHLDAVVLSHADVDHFNSLPKLAEQFSIGVVYVSPQMLNSDAGSVKELFEILAREKIQVRTITAGDQLQAGTSMAIDVLNPPTEGTGDSDNSDSVVLALEHLGSRILLPGDLELTGLSKLLNSPPSDFDVVMAAHHGSKHSHPVDFMNWSTPEFVVISGGSQRVTDKSVEKFAAPTREVGRTDRDGAIRFIIDQRGIQMKRWKLQPWQ